MPASNEQECGVGEVRGLMPDEERVIAETLRSLVAHYPEWTQYAGDEYGLIGFAFYEGCPERSACCCEILARAAPFALGKLLVEKHGFSWAAVRSVHSDWHYGVTHPSLDLPIDLNALEDGRLSSEEYDEPPWRGEPTYDSYKGIVGRLPSPAR